MSLFPKWKGVIELSPTPERRTIIGQNTVVQKLFVGATVPAEISDSQYEGHDLVVTKLGLPYRELLIRHAHARKLSTPIPVLAPAELPAAGGTLRVEWESLGDLETFAGTPEEVREAWLNKFIFAVEDVGKEVGLRPPQIGALHAIAAHFSVGSAFEPATVVLPTGTGKTETMLATTVYRRLPKVLVLVPSSPLRGQIADKFETLGILPHANTLPIEIARPFVTRVAKGLKTQEEARALVEASNVIVATPDILAASDPTARMR